MTIHTNNIITKIKTKTKTKTHTVSGVKLMFYLSNPNMPHHLITYLRITQSHSINSNTHI